MVRFSDIFKKKENGSVQTPHSLPKQKVKSITSQQADTEPKKKDEPSRRIRVIRVEDKGDRTDITLSKTSESAIESVPDEATLEEQIQHPNLKPKKTIASGKVSFAEAIRKPPETEQSVYPETHTAKEISLAKIIRQEDKEKLDKANKLYQQISSVIQDLSREINQHRDFNQLNYSDLLSYLDEAINLIITGDRTLLDMAHRYSDMEYLKFHQVNVGIISLYVGHEIGYNKSNLNELGALAFLHEIKAEETYKPSLIKTEKDYSKDELSIKGGLLLLRNIKYLGNAILSSLRQEYLTSAANRQSAELNAKELDGYIQIINLVDIYETRCRPRPHRKKMTPQIVIKGLIESAETFDKDLVKILIKLIGLYPVGTWLELNTGQIARAIRVNEKSPLRPVVQIVLDEEKRQIAKTKILDLITNQNIYIKRAVSEDELKELL